MVQAGAVNVNKGSGLGGEGDGRQGRERLSRQSQGALSELPSRWQGLLGRLLL